MIKDRESCHFSGGNRKKRQKKSSVMHRWTVERRVVQVYVFLLRVFVRLLSCCLYWEKGESGRAGMTSKVKR